VKDIEAENAKLKRMYADLALEHHAMDGPDRKKARRPPEQQAVIKYIRERHGLSVVRWCAVGNVLRQRPGFVQRGAGVQSDAYNQRDQKLCRNLAEAPESWSIAGHIRDPAAAHTLAASPVFCQVEAAETAVWLTEAAPNELDVLKGEDKDEVKKNNEAACVWISGIEIVNCKLGVHATYGLSTTPFFPHGSGYMEDTLFP
jgi:hypothetical protein